MNHYLYENSLFKRKVVVLGAGGFIGGHLVSQLKKGYWVRGVDIKRHEYKDSDADEFIVADLRDPLINGFST